MSNTPYHEFIRLAKLDQQLILDLAKTDLLKSQIVELNNKVEDAAKDLALSNTMLNNLKKKIDESQLELRSIDDQLSKKNRSLQSVSSPKQYESLTHEIEAANLSKDKIENDILSWYTELDDLSNVVQIKKSDFEKFKNLADISINEKEEMVELLEKDVQKVENEWKIALSILPIEWVEKYKKMRESVKNPVVPVLSNSCSACYSGLTASELNALRHHKLINCHDCYRLLYIEEN